MKNLNKKIGAVALASMVVLGGVAASGAQSFALLYGSLASDKKQEDDGIEKLQEIVNKSHAGKYEVIRSYYSSDILLQDVQEYYSGVKSFIPRVFNLNRFRNSDRYLKSLLNRRQDVVMVEYGMKSYLIERK